MKLILIIKLKLEHSSNSKRYRESLGSVNRIDKGVLTYNHPYRKVNDLSKFRLALLRDFSFSLRLGIRFKRKSNILSRKRG
jgi:hypothetical protein